MEGVGSTGDSPQMEKLLPAVCKNNLQLVGKGGDLSFLAEVGIRQGCPLSPLVFAVVADVLLRTITNRLMGRVVILRAFADDTAVTLKDIRSLEAAFQIFTEYAKFSPPTQPQENCHSPAVL